MADTDPYYDISITTNGCDKPALKQTTTAYAKGAAAFLRAAADEIDPIDPPRPAKTCRCATRSARIEEDDRLTQTVRRP